MTTTSPAASAVFNAVELLEAILLNFNTRDREEHKTLLLSQRVSNAFASTIADSPKLQHALFFRSSPDTNLKNPKHSYINSLLLESVVEEMYTKKIIIDPHNSHLLIKRARDSGALDVIVLVDPGLFRVPASAAVPFAAGSWQRMLLVQGDADRIMPVVTMAILRELPGPIMQSTGYPIKAEENLGDLLKRLWPGRWL